MAEGRTKPPEWFTSYIEKMGEVSENSKNLLVNGRRDGVNRLIEIATRIVLAGVVSLQVWMVRQIHTHEVRFTKIEANRFTSADGLRLVQKLADVQGSIPKEVPPKWFIEKVQNLENDLKDLQRRLLEGYGNKS